MKKTGLLLLALVALTLSNGCKPPAVSTPNPEGFKAPERIEAQTVGAGSGGATSSSPKQGSGPPSATQSQEVD